MIVDFHAQVGIQLVVIYRIFLRQHNELFRTPRSVLKKSLNRTLYMDTG